MSTRRQKSKIDHVRAARDLLISAGIELIHASADLGTPEEIDEARALAKWARNALDQLLDRSGLAR